MRFAMIVACSAAYRLPDFSWDHIPVAWHSAISGNFTQTDLKNLARYSLVTLEKTQGSAQFKWPHGLPLTCQNSTDLSSCGCCEEDNMVAAARLIKELNPRTHVVAYMNSVISYPWYRAARRFITNSSWYVITSESATLLTEITLRN